MGWTFTHKDKNTSVKAFFEQEFPSIEILDLAVVGMKTAYAACRQKAGPNSDRVWAMVCLLEYRPKDQFNFGYKDMDESMGPVEISCPARIFERLTPLPELTPLYEGHRDHAADWRARVQAKLSAHANGLALEDGDRIKMDQPLSFGRYGVHDTFTVRKDGRKVTFVTDSGLHCRISHFDARSYQKLAA